jgi:hypothetical protein
VAETHDAFGLGRADREGTRRIGGHLNDKGNLDRGGLATPQCVRQPHKNVRRVREGWLSRPAVDHESIDPEFTEGSCQYR